MEGMQRASYGVKDSEHPNMPLSPDHHPFTTMKNLHTMSFWALQRLHYAGIIDKSLANSQWPNSHLLSRSPPPDGGGGWN